MKKTTVLQTLIMILIVINVVEAGSALFLSQRAGLYLPHAQFPVFQGVSATGELVPDRNSSCYLIRLTAKGCSFCTQDHGEYIDILSHARKQQCEALVLSPRAGQLSDQDLTSGATPVTYINYEFGGAMIPTITPETLLLNAKRQLVWKSEGVISKAGAIKAVRVLKGLQTKDIESHEP